MKDRKFLLWLADRLVYVYGENEDTDFVLKLRDIALAQPEPQPQIQVSGPKCRFCGAFTTYARVFSHGMCMKCEDEKRKLMERR